VLGSIVLRRAWLKLRGLRFRAREGPLPAAEALRIDVCWSVTSGMTLIDPVMATAFQMRHLTAALRAGDPLRAALALGLEIGFRSLGGIPTRAAVEQASTLAHEVARQSGNQAASGLATATSGLAAFLRGDFKGALERLLTGERQMLDNASGFRWQIDVCQIFRVSALLYLGRLRELGQHVRMLLREARGRGDAYLAGAMRSWRGNHAWLLADEPEEARRVALQAGPAPDGAGAFHLQHYYRLVTHANIDLYAGDPAAAWRRVTACWPGLVRSMVLRTQSVRIEGWFLRARCALALAAHAPEQSGALLAEVEAAARRIERERAPWGAPLAELARAAAAALRGQRAPATALLERAARGFAAVHMDAFAAVARRRHAELAGDDAAAGEAHAWLQREAVARPERLVALFAPGFTAG